MLIELLNGTSLSEPVRAAIEQDAIHPYTTILALAEAEYILCRSAGHEKAREKVDKLLLSRTLEIVSEDSILHEVGRMKCERSIALGDCHTLAIAAKLKGTALFARAEEDLARETRKKPFPVKLMFLEQQRPVRPVKVTGPQHT